MIVIAVKWSLPGHERTLSTFPRIAVRQVILQSPVIRHDPHF
jgi:hypothetical protein